MGGYAAYVWPSYGVAFVVLAGILIASVRGARTEETALAVLEAQGADRRARRRQRNADGAGAASAEETNDES